MGTLWGTSQADVHFRVVFRLRGGTPPPRTPPNAGMGLHGQSTHCPTRLRPELLHGLAALRGSAPSFAKTKQVGSGNRC